MSLRFGLLYTNKQVKEKFGRLRIDYNVFNAIKKQSGSGWDEATKTVNPPPHYWEKVRGYY